MDALVFFSSPRGDDRSRFEQDLLSVGERLPVAKRLLGEADVARSGENSTFYRYGGADASVFEGENTTFAVYGSCNLDLVRQTVRGRQELSAEELSSLAEMDGCYSLVIRFEKSGLVYAVGDRIGQRQMRFVAGRNGSITIASHDFLLALSGACAPDIAPETRAVMDQVGWSVNGESMLTGAVAVPRGRALKVDGGKAEIVDLPAPYPEASAQSIYDTVVNSFAKKLDDPRDILVELSAGYDSRASLGATRVAYPDARITAFCEGPDDSMDVEVAREICRRAGIAFERRDAPEAGPMDFLEEWERSSAETNGHINVTILASHDPQVSLGTGDPQVCGDAAEIYSGVYYPFQPFMRTAPSPGLDAMEYIRGRFFAKVTDELWPEVNRRLDAFEEETRRLTRSDFGVVDGFYTIERYGVWNQKLIKQAPGLNRICPFWSRRGARQLLSLEGIPAYKNDLHGRLIAEGVPEALDLPVNGMATVSERRFTGLRAAPGDLRDILGKVRGKLDAKLGRTRPDNSDARTAHTLPILAALYEEDARVRTCLAAFGIESAEDIAPVAAAKGVALWQGLGFSMFEELCRAGAPHRRA